MCHKALCKSLLVFHCNYLQWNTNRDLHNALLKCVISNDLDFWVTWWNIHWHKALHRLSATAELLVLIAIKWTLTFRVHLWPIYRIWCRLHKNWGHFLQYICTVIHDVLHCIVQSLSMTTLTRGWTMLYYLFSVMHWIAQTVINGILVTKYQWLFKLTVCRFWFCSLQMDHMSSCENLYQTFRTATWSCSNTILKRSTRTADRPRCFRSWWPRWRNWTHLLRCTAEYFLTLIHRK